MSRGKHYAHTKGNDPDPGHWEGLEEHLLAVAERAGEFAEAFQSREWGYLAGLWHDLGKYSEKFQAYLSSNSGLEAHLETRAGKVDHSTAGAQHAAGRFGALGHLLAYCIAGHHGGMPDGVDREGSTKGLQDHLKKRVESFDDAPSELLEQTPPTLPSLEVDADSRRRAFQASVFCRMIFSALVDADSLATEKFVRPELAAARPQIHPEPPELLRALDRFLDHKHATSPDTAVNCKRRAVLEACRSAAEVRPGLFSLTVPTGGGKTLSSLAFALTHAVRYGHRRVIYAIPFTSIIEQNADVFRRALGGAGARAVLEHHSNLEPAREEHWARLATENWDAPVIVTTNVQLFESLFDNRPSRCRKLHRIADSVVVLDEAQTLPVELLTSSLAILEELCRNYGCTVVLCTATQPAVVRRDDFPIGLPNVREITPDVMGLFADLKRTDVELVGLLSDDQLAERILEHEQALCVVNTRRHAAAVCELVAPGGAGDCLHLSAQMCAEHRSDVLQLILRKLRRGDTCRVVSTQVVEAGVDVDFPVVFRAMAGLDSIAQAAGRCNREGHLRQGRVVVFETDAGSPHHVRQAAQDTREVSGPDQDLLGPGTIQEFFRLHYWKRQDQWDRHGVMECFSMASHGLHAQFREAAHRYRIIRDEQVPVIVAYGRRGRELVEELRRTRHPPGRGFDRRCQRYIVGLHQRDYDRLLQLGIVGIYHERFSVLEDMKAYDSSLGLRVRTGGFTPSELIQ